MARQRGSSGNSIDLGLGKQVEVLKQLRELLDRPAVLSKQVELDLAADKARLEIAKQISQERNRQQYGSLVGGARNLLGIGTGPGATGISGGAGGGLGGALAGLGGAAAGAASAIAQLAIKTVGLASPATMQRFNLVMEDTLAVVGDRLRPVIEILTDAFKLLGDWLETILPSADEFREILSPVTDFLSELRDALASIAPIVKDVLVVAFKALGIALNALMVPIRFLVGFLQGLFGLEGAEALKSSTGKAARSIQFGDPMSAVKQVYAAAYLGSAGTRQQGPLDGIAKDVSAAVKELQAIGKSAAEIGRAVAALAKHTLGEAWDAINKAVGTNVSPKDFLDTVLHDFPSVIDQIVHAPGSPFGEKGPEPGLRPRDEAQAEAFSNLGRVYGVAQRRAQAIGMLPFGREAAGQFSKLDQLIDEIRRLARVAGAGGKYEEEINHLLEWAGMTSRRGIDGSAAGG